MKYKAVTFDTSTVQQKSFKFEQGILARLEQFSNRLINIVVSDIVVREIRNHMIVRGEKAMHKIQNGLRDAFSAGLISRECADTLCSEINMIEIIDEQIKVFIHNIGAKIIKSSMMRDRLDELIERYFSKRPPFDASSKQNEFKDAITLMCIEEWARSSKCRVLAISNDGDWRRFAQQSDWIDVTEDLADALNELSADANIEAEKIGQKICTAISDISHWLHMRFREKLEIVMDDITPEVRYESSANVEPDVPDLALKEFDIVKYGNNYSAKILQIGDGVIYLQIEADVTVDATCTFDFQAWDSIDKESVPLGSRTIIRGDEILKLDLIVELEGDLDSVDDLDVSSVTVESHSPPLDFGFLEPFPDVSLDDLDEPNEYNARYDDSDDLPF